MRAPKLGAGEGVVLSARVVGEGNAVERNRGIRHIAVGVVHENVRLRAGGRAEQVALRLRLAAVGIDSAGALEPGQILESLLTRVQAQGGVVGDGNPDAG